MIANEKTATIADVWDGGQLKITFRRCFNREMFAKWYEIIRIAQSIQFKDEDDAIIWKLEANGIYTVSSLYAVVNFRGVMPVHVHKVWSIKVPPKIHFFLWLLTHNKLLTRDNLSKRQQVDDASCIFCSEPETSTHVFLECVVAKVVWERICEFTIKTDSPVSHEFIASTWGGGEKNSVINIVHASILWSIWLTRNDMFFNKTPWLGTHVIWRKAACLLSQWMIMFSGDAKGRLATVMGLMEHLVRAPPLLLWPDPR